MELRCTVCPRRAGVVTRGQSRRIDVQFQAGQVGRDLGTGAQERALALG